MKLYLMRHGRAVHQDVNPKRPLSPDGREEVTGMGRFLKSNEIRIDTIVYSTKTRARETAELLSKTLGFKGEMTEWKKIAPDDLTDLAIEKIEEYKIEYPEQSLLMVSHLPFIPVLIRKLLNDPDAVRPSYPEACILCLESTEDSRWILQNVWLPSEKKCS